MLSEEQAQTLLERRAVVALAIPLFTRNIWRNNFMQAALGAELRLQGCSGSALDALNTMGLCQNKDTVRLLLHRLRNGKKNVSIMTRGAGGAGLQTNFCKFQLQPEILGLAQLIVSKAQSGFIARFHQGHMLLSSFFPSANVKALLHHMIQSSRNRNRPSESE